MEEKKEQQRRNPSIRTDRHAVDVCVHNRPQITEIQHGQTGWPNYNGFIIQMKNVVKRMLSKF